MATAMTIQQRMDEVRARLQSLRPGFLQQGQQMLQQRGGGQVLGSMRGRAIEFARGRPVLGQALEGRLLSGGHPTQASANFQISEAGFRAPSGVEGQAMTPVGSGYRFATR